jgi:HTH-type transcriptional regulator/antitoxin HigA
MSIAPPPIRETYTCPFVVPPGEILEEKINEMGLSTEEFAGRIAATTEALVQLFKGRLPLSTNLAFRLECATGIPADYWNQAEANYRLKLANMSMGTFGESDT